jgi:hypothetical protein
MSGITQTLFNISSAAGWTFRSVGSAGTGVSPVAGMPAGFASGDLLVIAGASAAAFTDPAGWTVGVNNSASGSQVALSFWYKISNGSETAVTVPNGSATATAVMVAYSGINAVPLDVNGTTASANSTTTPTTNSLTTTAANDLVISIFGATTNALTWTSPGSTNVRFDSAGQASTKPLLIVDELKTATGATTTRTATLSSAANNRAHAVSFKV